MAELDDVMTCLGPMLQDRHIGVEADPEWDHDRKGWRMRLLNPDGVTAIMELPWELVDDAEDGAEVCGIVDRSGILQAIATAMSHRKLMPTQSGYVELTE